MSGKGSGSFQHRTLHLVRQPSATDTVCELAVSEGINPACGQCGGCASALTASDIPAPIGIDLPKSLLVQQNLHPMKVGQSIELTVSSAMLLALSSVVYLLPVVLMLFFAVSCDLFFASSEGQIAGSAIVGLCLGLGSIVVFEPTLRSYISKRLTLRSGTDS